MIEKAIHLNNSIKSQVRVPKVGERCNGKRGLFFTHKNTKGADSFRCNRKKKRNGHYVTPISLYIAYIRRKSKVENLRFSPFLFEFFLSIAVSSLRRMYIRLSVGERRFPLEINLSSKKVGVFSRLF